MPAYLVLLRAEIARFTLTRGFASGQGGCMSSADADGAWLAPVARRLIAVAPQSTLLFG